LGEDDYMPFNWSNYYYQGFAKIGSRQCEEPVMSSEIDSIPVSFMKNIAFLHAVWYSGIRY
jgi:hypothetical protein